MNITPPDILFSLILLYFTINGLLKGLIKEITGLVSLFISCYIASEYHGKLYSLINTYLISDDNYSQIIAFFIIFFTAIIIIKILSSLIQGFFEFVYLGWLNKLLGALLGFIKGLIIISIIIFCLGAMPFDEKTINQIHDDSSIYRIGNNIKKYLLKNATDRQDFLKDLKNLKKEYHKLESNVIESAEELFRGNTEPADSNSLRK